MAIVARFKPRWRMVAVVGLRIKEVHCGVQKGHKPGQVQLQLWRVFPKRRVLRLSELSPQEPPASGLLLSCRCREDLRPILRTLCTVGRSTKGLNSLCKFPAPFEQRAGGVQTVTAAEGEWPGFLLRSFSLLHLSDTGIHETRRNRLRCTLQQQTGSFGSQGGVGHGGWKTRPESTGASTLRAGSPKLIR